MDNGYFDNDILQSIEKQVLSNAITRLEDYQNIVFYCEILYNL